MYWNYIPRLVRAVRVRYYYLIANASRPHSRVHRPSWTWHNNNNSITYLKKTRRFTMDTRSIRDQRINPFGNTIFSKDFDMKPTASTQFAFNTTRPDGTRRSYTHGVNMSWGESLFDSGIGWWGIYVRLFLITEKSLGNLVETWLLKVHSTRSGARELIQFHSTHWTRYFSSSIPSFLYFSKFRIISPKNSNK